jgi:hypothetical protein
MSGNLIGGALGANIKNLTPTAQQAALEAENGNVGNAVGIGLTGISTQVHDNVASVALQTAGQTAGIAVDQAIAGNDSNALLAGLTTLTNTSQAVQQVVNPG